MIWKIGKRQNVYWQLLTIPKSPFPEVLWMTKSSFRALPVSLIELTEKKVIVVGMDKLHKGWIPAKYQYITEDSKVVVYLSQLKRSWMPVVRRLVKKVGKVIFRVLVAALVTFLYAAWEIDQAYLRRGYKAYGGEYIVIPFVFYLAIKGLILLDRLCYMIKTKKMHKEV